MIIDTITLPDSLRWADEFAWSPVAQTQDRSVTGAFLLQEQLRQYGRPITLQGDDESVWVSRSTVLELHALEAQLNRKFSVTLPDGRVFTCAFNRNGGQAIDAEHFWRWDGIPGPDAHYTIKQLRLITVEP